METLCYQAHPSTSHEAAACICEPQEWWESGKIIYPILFLKCHWLSVSLLQHIFFHSFREQRYSNLLCGISTLGKFLISAREVPKKRE